MGHDRRRCLSAITGRFWVAGLFVRSNPLVLRYSTSAIHSTTDRTETGGTDALAATLQPNTGTSRTWVRQARPNRDGGAPLRPRHRGRTGRSTCPIVTGEGDIPRMCTYYFCWAMVCIGGRGERWTRPEGLGLGLGLALAAVCVSCLRSPRIRTAGPRLPEKAIPSHWAASPFWTAI